MSALVAATVHRTVAIGSSSLPSLSQKRRGHRLSSFVGPSGETRTPGILLPKQARYQLRYTRLFDCRSFPKAGALPVAVPEKIIGLTLILDFFDRGHSLGSLFPPPAAVASLPNCATPGDLRCAAPSDSASMITDIFALCKCLAAVMWSGPRGPYRPTRPKASHRRSAVGRGGQSAQ